MADNHSLFPIGFTPFEMLSGRDPSEPILVAFSGGADSRVLFDLTANYCREIHSFCYACHVNHGIRGDEALRDRDFCIETAKSCPECKCFCFETALDFIIFPNNQAPEVLYPWI